MEDRFVAIMVLHALGDTIGFKNGDWEFNYNDISKRDDIDYVNEMIYEFIDLGGINGIDLKDWKVSDDTIYHLSVARGLLLSKKYDFEQTIENIQTEMLYDSIKIVDESVGLMRYNYETREPFDKSEYKKIPKFERYQGKATYEGIKKFMAPGSFSKDSDVKTYHNLVYNPEAGGNGSAMRTLCIGMCYFGENNRESLIDLSLYASVITHYNAYGYLAGLNASLFVAFALEGIPIKKWPYLLLEYLKSSNAKKYLTIDDSDHIYDYSMYIRYWNRYIETKFDKNGNPLKLKSNKNPMHRIRYFYDNFHKDSNEQQIGASGFLCMIMAYDALLDCDGKWEKLVVYAILHNGDSDTIGAVAGGLYGAVYGFGDVPQSMLKHLEKKEELIKVAKGLYDRYAKPKKK